MDKSDSDGQEQTASRGFPTKFIWLIVLVAVISFGYYQLSDVLTFKALAERENALRAVQQQQWLMAYGVAFLIYVAVTGLSLPGATVLTLSYGWFFGFSRGLLLVSFASTTGATLAFLLSRYLFREAVERRFGERLTRFNDALRRDGSYFLFTLRLIPAVPFFVINAVMGLTPLRTTSFWWVSQLGMLPGTAVYVYAGSSVPGLQALADEGIGAVFSAGQLTRILIAFALLGLFPLAARFLLRYFGFAAPSKSSESNEQTGT